MSPLKSNNKIAYPIYIYTMSLQQLVPFMCQDFLAQNKMSEEEEGGGSPILRKRRSRKPSGGKVDDSKKGEKGPRVEKQLFSGDNMQRTTSDERPCLKETVGKHKRSASSCDVDEKTVETPVCTSYTLTETSLGEQICRTATTFEKVINLPASASSSQIFPNPPSKSISSPNSKRQRLNVTGVIPPITPSISSTAEGFLKVETTPVNKPTTSKKTSLFATPASSTPTATSIFQPVSSLLKETKNSFPFLSLGCPLLDRALAGGIRRSALTEVASHRASKLNGS